MSVAPTTKPPATKPPYVPPLHGPWPAIHPWSRHWHPTGRPASVTVVVAVGAAALIAALAVPLDRTGIGWLVTALAGAAALAVARRAPDRLPAGAPEPLVPRPSLRRRADRLAWASATVALFAVGAFRAAGWLFLLCLATATITGALALTGGRSMRSIAAGYTMQPIAGFRAVPWLGRGAARLRRTGTGAAPNVRIVATVSVSVLLLVVFGTLFASADATFAHALEAIAPTISVPAVARWIFVGVVAAVLIGGAAFLCANPPELSGLDGTEGRKVNRLEWAIPLGLLVALFAAFVVVQLTVLFGGDGHVQGTDGLTYANYARGGFWQLSFVTGLTLIVLAGAARWAPRTTATDRTLIRVVLGTLAGLTLVIVVSALLRMNLYAETYGLTRLRLLVACCEAWFGLVLLLVLVAGVRIRAPWLPRVAIAVGVAALIGLAVANPDRVIAGYNLKQDHDIDLQYLAELSPDAAPALTGLSPEAKACVLGQIAARLDDDPDDWRGWNLGRERARKLISDFRISDYRTELLPTCS